ncbi:transcriptional repressor [Litorisediminicola beolgyonensis]|uniref:Transcriptional repressor n=1 Tax=Litorisediminicola beolgyonensis TaxID=1173614 RepID=A0ABW3ZDH6_9RHOB
MPEALGFESHDHKTCISAGMREAEARCAERGLQFTPIRRRVLEILLTRHKAMGAYEILDVLREDGHAAQPPAAYRALDFLTAHGFAHRIERRNAFLACVHPGERHAPAFLICRSCDRVAEAAAAPIAVKVEETAAEIGFAVERMVMEVEGLCPRCREDAE